MQTIMFLTGTVVGLFLGAILWEVLVAGPEHVKARQREYRLSDRVRAWQRMYLYAEGAKAATERAIYDATHAGEADTFSRKVTDLTVVK